MKQVMDASDIVMDRVNQYDGAVQKVKAAVTEALSNNTPSIHTPSSSYSTDSVVEHISHEVYDRALQSIAQMENDSTLSPVLHGVIKRPSHWGGYLIRPYQMEFWANGIYRLHSRIRYTATQYIPKGTVYTPPPYKKINPYLIAALRLFHLFLLWTPDIFFFVG